MPKALILTLLVMLASPSNLLAAPEADLWERWTAHDPNSDERIDHRRWGELLRQYLYVGEDRIHLFAYGKVIETDRDKLNRYIDRLSLTVLVRINPGTGILDSDRPGTPIRLTRCGSPWGFFMSLLPHLDIFLLKPLD